MARWWRGLGLALLLGCAAPGPLGLSLARAAPPAKRPPRCPTVYHKNRNFRIPFVVEAGDRARLTEVQLYVSDDSGFTWKMVSRTTPDNPYFTYRTNRDGEYWFAVRRRDKDGRLYPGEDEQIEPSMKVIVDTAAPSLVLEPDGRLGSRVAVRWEVRDENLDKQSLVIEYQAEGASAWRQVPISNKALIGSATWEAGTAEPLLVRGTVADKAGNKAEQTITISEGTPQNPGPITNDSTEFSAPPPISRISTGGGFPPDELPRGPGDSEPYAARPSPAIPPGGSLPGGFDSGGFGPNERAGPGGGALSSAGRGGGAGGGQTLLVASPQFALQYAVDDAGPSGPATVELWVTQNGGRSWSRRGEDPDRTSPFPVDLGGDGTFGICLVARAASGLGDPPPAPGDPPQSWVEVDSTPPNVQLEPPVVGTAQHLGKLAMRWRASDLHLGPQPVTLAWRADQPGAQWYPIAEHIENTGQYIWTVPPNVPARFHIRIDVVDAVGNRGTAETTEGNPVIVDRTRPRSRILGLDPSARTGRGANPVAGSGAVLPR
jgi:hypothetical protein